VTVAVDVQEAISPTPTSAIASSGAVATWAFDGARSTGTRGPGEPLALSAPLQRRVNLVIASVFRLKKDRAMTLRSDKKNDHSFRQGAPMFWRNFHAVRRCVLVALSVPLMGAGVGAAQDFGARIPMEDKGVSTYYVQGHIQGFGAAEFMVDTGSGYTTINEETLAVLEAGGNAHYVKDLVGVMADGSRSRLPVYRIASITIGDECAVHNVEAAIFPGRTRQMLGLSALRKVSPFVFALDPPSLMLSNCGSGVEGSPLGLAPLENGRDS